MMIPQTRPLSLAAALAGAVALALPAAAAADPPDAKFIGSFEGTQSTTYIEPKHNNLVTCGGTNGRAMKSTEVVRIRTQPTKMTAQRTGAYISWVYGSFGRSEPEKRGIPGRMTVSRTSAITLFNEPGSCGIGGGPSQALPAKCGTQSRNVIVKVNSYAGRLGVAPTLEPGASFDFSNCIGISPMGVLQGQLTPITQEAPAGDLLDPRFGKQIILASKTFRQSYSYRFNGRGTATTVVRWALTLKRVR